MSDKNKMPTLDFVLAASMYDMGKCMGRFDLIATTDLSQRQRHAIATARAALRSATEALGSLEERTGKVACPYVSHAADCDCNGMGGDR